MPNGLQQSPLGVRLTPRGEVVLTWRQQKTTASWSAYQYWCAVPWPVGTEQCFRPKEYQWPLGILAWPAKFWQFWGAGGFWRGGFGPGPRQ